MRLGLIARADDGGLGALTWELWRHLEPWRTLIVHTQHQTRGTADVSRYASEPGSVRATRRSPMASDIQWLLEGGAPGHPGDGPIDVLLTAETWYSHTVQQQAFEHGIRTVLYAMPEMHDAREHADRIFVPTGWRQDLVPGSKVLPMFVARDRLPFGHREKPVLYHVASNAFHDRNGTELVLAAAQLMRSECRLLIRGDIAPGRSTSTRSRVTIEWLPHHFGPYYEAWPLDASIYIGPRRFGGLSLPLLEAQSLGMATVVLDRYPETQQVDDGTRVQCWTGETGISVKNGTIDADTCDPAVLAGVLDCLLEDDVELIAAQYDSMRVAETNTWPELREQWLAALE